MKKFTYMLVNIALVSVIILAGTAAVKTIEDIRHERVERAKTEYEYKYKETVNFSIEDAGRYNEKNVYKISIYDRETGIIELTEAGAYKYDTARISQDSHAFSFIRFCFRPRRTSLFSAFA